MSDTIVGPATAAGRAGVAVIRISGRQTLEIKQKVVDLGGVDVEPRRLVPAGVRHPTSGELVDRGMVCWMPGPASYTGEDVLELQIHGGVATVRAALAACLAAGARMADPGEFSLRAFLNGKMDLTEAEAVCALVEARSDRARRMALQQLDGALSTRVEGIRARLIDALAELEARLDFPEEEIEPLGRSAVARRVEGVLAEIDGLIGQYGRARLVREGARLVIVGRPNAGKSSLLNALLGRTRAIVSAEPGTTRDYIEAELEVGGVSISLVDTAGVRRAESDTEAAGVEMGLDQLERADFVLLVCDAEHGMGTEEARIRRRVKGLPLGVVINKRDLADETRITALETEAGDDLVGLTVATSGEGVSELLTALGHRLLGATAVAEMPLVSEARHYERLRSAALGLRRAGAMIGEGRPEELVALELRAATEAVGAIVGRGIGDDLLSAIFSRFCLGK